MLLREQSFSFNTSISVTLVQSEKKTKEVCWLLRSRTERGSNRAVLWSRARRCCKNQGFTCPVHPFLASSARLDIVKVPKTQIWDKLGAIWLFNSNEPQTIITENSCDNYTHRAFWQSMTHTSYTVAQAIKISEASNCRTSYSFVQLHVPGRQLLEFLRGSCAYTIVLFFEHEIHLSYKLKRKQALLSIWGK